jgi:hypothetical protein
VATPDSTSAADEKAESARRAGLSFSPARCVDVRTVVVTQVDKTATQSTYHGRVLHWSTGKSRTLELEFSAPWYADRTITLFLWSDKIASLKVYLEDAVAPTDVTLAAPASGIAATQLVSLGVPLTTRSSPGTVRVTVVHQAGEAPAHIQFGLSTSAAGSRTAVARHTTLDSRTFVLACTWTIVICALFAAFAPLGSYGFLLVALPAVPALLKYAGLDTALKIDISGLALWLHQSRKWGPRGIFEIGAGSLFSLALALYVAIGLAAPLIYADELEEALNSPMSRMKDVELLCAYPERLETRALVARRFSLIQSESGAWEGAISTIRQELDTDAFIDCLGKFRFSRHFNDAPTLHGDEARAFYSAIIFYSIDELKKFPAAMDEIRKLLLPGGAPAGPLSELAWRTYATRMEKNIGEKEACVGPTGHDSVQCQAARMKCIAADKELENLLAKREVWSYLDRRQNTIYIEARDVAASARLSRVCSNVADSDIKQAIRHYEAMLGAIPGEPRLDRPLSSINLRALAESRLSTRPSGPISEGWKRACSEELQHACAEIQEAIVGTGDRKFFLKDRTARHQDWDKASLAQANYKDLRDIALSEAKRNWRKPWASRQQ